MGNPKNISFPLLKIGYAARKNLTPDEAKKLAPKNKVVFGDQFERLSKTLTDTRKFKRKRVLTFQIFILNLLAERVGFEPTVRD